MPIFPQIQSPCPYKSRLSSVMDGDLCRMCNRRVFDLSFMSDDERVAFMKGCGDDQVCVSYRLQLRPAVAAAALAVAAASIPTAAAATDEDETAIVVGGIPHSANARFVSLSGVTMPVPSAVQLSPVSISLAEPRQGRRAVRPAGAGAAPRRHRPR